MAVQKILLLGHPVLRAKCARVKNVREAAVRRTIRDLADTLNNFRNKNRFGRGIAAPQIGVRKRIILVTIDGEQHAMINPRITWRSQSTMRLWDDCFSFPDILVRVERYRSIMVSYRDAGGKQQVLRAVDSLAELLQHEIDHLDGILAIDRAISTQYIILRSELKKQR